jgi:hypothetical protein
MLEGKDFFMKLYNADCPKIVVENPTPLGICELPKYSQAIQPCEHGEPFKKRTCLWVKGLPLLKPTNIVKGEPTTVPGNWYNKAGKNRAIIRRKTFQGIADAMAEQWG